MQTTEQSFLEIQKYVINSQEIHIVRDDIFPFIGGGSKARKAIEYEKYLKENGYNAIVTCGGVQSNHNRAMALIAARNGWECHLCIQDENNRFYKEKGNALIDRMSGAKCEIINPEETSSAMNRAMEMLQKEGYKPFYVTGGGHDLPGGNAFINAVKILKYKCEKHNYKPDYIFHASGTGSTQAGILVGLDLMKWSDVKVVGISVARQHDRGAQVITEFANKLALHHNIKKDYKDKVLFKTDYLFGGYEKDTEEMKEFLLETTRKTGLIFDTTYSGKAFYGMMDIIKNNSEMKNKKILFWHTGGLMNIQK